MTEAAAANDVLRVGAKPHDSLFALAARYGVTLSLGAAGEALPGSYWGDSEAGLMGNVLHVRPDTPLHSLLHELCHYICMTQQRRVALERDAGGDDAEENAVCYLQLLLADEIAGFDRARAFADMDAWGYSFRLGSARQWFEADAADACIWLQRNGVVDDRERPTFRLRP